MCAFLYLFEIVCNKPHANPTIIYKNIKEIHILTLRGIPGIPILNHVRLRRGPKFGLKLHSGPHQKQFGGTYCHRENLRRATEKVIEGPEVCSRTKVSNMAYNLCLCRFQASMLNTL